MGKRRGSPLLRAVQVILLPLAVLAVLLCFTTALGNLDSAQSEESMRQLEQALRRGCVAGYAAEGSYPADLDYLKEHYGLVWNEERYWIDYQPIGSNLMPDVTVVKHGGAR